MKSVDFTCNINDPAYKCGYEEGYRIGYDIHILRNAQAQVFKS